MRCHLLIRTSVDVKYDVPWKTNSFVRKPESKQWATSWASFQEMYVCPLMGYCDYAGALQTRAENYLAYPIRNVYASPGRKMACMYGSCATKYDMIWICMLWCAGDWLIDNWVRIRLVANKSAWNLGVNKPVQQNLNRHFLCLSKSCFVLV